MRLDGVHAGRRLVEQEQPRLGRRRAGDLEPAPVRVREAVGGLRPSGSRRAARRRSASRSSASCAISRSSRRMPGVRRTERSDARLRVPVGSGHDVLLDRHVQEQPQRLERPRDAAARDLVRVEAEDDSSLEEDLALLGGYTPVITLNSVVLPAPFGPITLTISPSPTVRSSPSRHAKPAERERELLHLEQRRALVHVHTISTRCLPEQPLRPVCHERDEQRADQDEASDRRLRDQEVRPHARREVEDRDQPHESPDSAAHQREARGRPRSSRCMRAAGASPPAARPRSRCLGEAGPRSRRVSSIRDSPKDAPPASDGRTCSATSCTTMPKTTVAPSTAKGCHHGRSIAMSAIATTRRRSSSRCPASRRASNDRVDRAPRRPSRRADAACTPEDDHRVHGDQEHEIEVRGEDGALQPARRCAPATPATPAPTANAISFSRLTGIVISSAASSSSRSARQARPVRDSFKRYRNEMIEHERDEGDVVVGVEGRDLPPEELERVDVGDPVRPTRTDALMRTTSQSCRKKSVTIAR